MRKSEVFDKCVYNIERLLREKKLWVRHSYRCPAQVFFAMGCKLYSGICVSSVESEVGTITRAWGIVFTDPEYTKRCTDIHTTYYHESVALEKLLRELQTL